MSVALTAVGVALAAGYYSVPDPPDLDGAHWFRTILANVLVGEVEASQGDGDAWENRFSEFVAREHWQGDVRHSVLGDPDDLGPNYSPATWLGPAASWAAVNHWQGMDEALAGSVTARWILVSGAPGQASGLLERLAEQLGQQAIVVEWAQVPAADASTKLTKLIEGTRRTAADRFIMVGEGEGVQVLAHAMSSNAGLRDLVPAVLSIQGVFYGTDALDKWMEEFFTHALMDTERVGVTPWMSLQWADRDDLTLGRFRQPPGEMDSIWGVEVVDLGTVFPANGLVALARSLRLVVSCWVLARQ